MGMPCCSLLGYGPLLASLVLAAIGVPLRASGQSLVARQVLLDNTADLFSGAKALGGMGDWYLSNGIIQAIVDNVGFQADVLEATGRYLPVRTFGLTGGTLIDLGLVGRDNDQLNWLSQTINFDGRSPVLYVPRGFISRDPAHQPILASVDEVAGEASLTVFGFVYFPLNDPFDGKLLTETRYLMRRGERVLRIRTTVTNRAELPAPVSNITDVLWLGDGGLHVFAPYPEGGFGVSSTKRISPFFSLVGSLSPEDGVVDTAAMLAAGEVSYTLFSPEASFLTGAANPSFLNVGAAASSGSLDPGSTLTYERRIVVGDRNDAASSTNAVLAEISSSMGRSPGVVRGQLRVTDGMPFRANVEWTLLDLAPPGPTTTTILSQANGDSRPQPLTQVITSSGRGGVFEAVLPAGRYALRVNAEQRPSVDPREVTVVGNGFVDVGDIELPSLGCLVYRVTEGGVLVPAKITIKGRLGTVDPVFGLPIDTLVNGILMRYLVNQTDPAFNVSYTATGAGELCMKPGNYIVFASRGTEYNFDAKPITISSAQTTGVDLAISRAVDTTGYVSADFHVHAARSPDTAVPPVDRVKNFAAEGVNVLVSSDHNVLFDYRPIIAQLGLDSRMTSIVGGEASTGKSSPEGPAHGNLGHWNGWPLVVNPPARKDGAPEEGYVEPAVIFDRLRRGGAEVIQLNHPARGSLGYLSNNGFDPNLPTGEGPNAFLHRASILGTGTRNIDFDLIEIFNSGDGTLAAYSEGRRAWFSFLNQGLRKVATAVTDSHSLAMRHAGVPRTYVSSGVTDMRQFDAGQFDRSLKEGRAFGTSGPFLRVRALSDSAAAELGETITSGPNGVSLSIRIQAPCWIPVEEVRVFGNGAPVQTIDVGSSCTSPVRYESQLEFRPAVDTYYVVEAGQRLPDDGSQPAWPTGMMSILEPLVLSLAFTNPVFVDVDGDGDYDPPGI